MSQRRRRRTTHPRAVKRVLILLAAVVVLWILSQLFLSIQAIHVKGNRYLSAEQVIQASGLEIGDNLLTLNSGNVRKSINANRYLEFVSLWPGFFPASVTLTVSEHAPRAKLSWMGMLVLIGDNSVVLEHTSTIDLPVHVPEITGMTLSTIYVGQPITFTIAGQSEAMDAVLDALVVQNLTADILQINVAVPDNIFMLTADGLEIYLGSADDMNEKIALIRDTLPRIQARADGPGGKVDVSTGRVVDYMPPVPDPTPVPTEAPEETP